MKVFAGRLINLFIAGAAIRRQQNLRAFELARCAQIPAVTHVDGSGRLQTVDRASNSLYYASITALCLTGIPMVLNTSFNENEPVVCRPEEP